MSANTPAGPILSIFDFDGTLFKSPSPSEAFLAKYGNATRPTFAGGLGFFQSNRTLAPPYVPLLVKGMETSAVSTAGVSTSGGTAAAVAADLAFDHFDRWFITPTVDAYVEAKKRGDVTAILTGREKYFTERLSHLLTNCGFKFDHLFLKENPRGGTVAYKVDVFMKLIEQYKPSQIIYYEDRAEQGLKIEEALKDAFANKLTAELCEHYTKNFKMIMIDPSLSDTILSPEHELTLAEELVNDAKEEARKRREHGGGHGNNRDYYDGLSGGGRGRSSRHSNKPDKW